MIPAGLHVTDPTGDREPGAPLVVVVFTGTLCPINNAFMPVLAKLHA